MSKTTSFYDNNFLLCSVPETPVSRTHTSLASGRHIHIQNDRIIGLNHNLDEIYM